MPDVTEQQLVELAINARTSAYAPYSKFQVGAALLTASGDVFQGCNVENSSYGLSICAERTAVTSAVTAGHRKFLAIAIAASPMSTPCGACRQFLAEFGLEIRVISVDPENPTKTGSWTVSELLPDSFRLTK